MPQPFSVRDQDKPGIDLGMWDENGNITVPGSVTANGVVLTGGGGGGGGTVTSVTAADSTITATGTSTVTIAVNAIPESKVTNLVSDLALKAPLASPAFTGNISSAGTLVLTPDTITYAASITPDCSLSNYFRVTLTGALTINAPINPVDGQKITFELIQDATGSRLVTLNAAFGFGSQITTFTASTGASKHDFLGVIYNATASKFYVVALAQGY